MFVLVTQCLGMLAGAFVFQQLVAAYADGGAQGWQMIWVWPCLAAAIVALGFWWRFDGARK